MKIPQAVIEPFGVLGWPTVHEVPPQRLIRDWQHFEVSIVTGTTGHRPTAIPNGTLRTDEETFGIEAFIDGKWVDAETVMDNDNS